MIARRELIAGAAALPLAGAGAPGPERIATGLRFPEGPLVDRDGSVIVSEIAAGRLTRVLPGGRKAVAAEPGGGPNGNAWGPGGAILSCNNGGFAWAERGGLLIPGHRAAGNAGGRIDRIDPATGRVEALYRSTPGAPLHAPNDLVLDGRGGFWFTDSGHTTAAGRDNGAILWAALDGSALKRVVGELIAPNGIGLSPDGRTLYVALTNERQLLAFHVLGPGRLAPLTPLPGRVVASFPGRTYLDSLKVDAAGNISVATLVDGGIATVSPAGARVGFAPVPDLIVTNLAWGGPGLRTAFVTAGSAGALYRLPWPRAGLALPYSRA